MRVMDIVMAVPGIAMAAVSVLVFGRTLSKSGNTFGLVVVIICSIAFVYIPQLSRIVRANVMAAYGEDYVRAVIVSGARAPWILTKHVMRNTAAPVLVFATVLVADAIILEASLTFIGSGLQATTVATWGNVLSEASSNLSVLLGKWWTAFFPGLFIMITVLCLNILSEGITDAMVAAPASAAVAQVDKDTDREADKLLLEPAPRLRRAGRVPAGPPRRPRVRRRQAHRPLRGAPGEDPAARGQRPVHQVRASRQRQRRRPRLLQGPPRRDHGPRGRVRLRQVDHGSDHHGPHRPQGCRSRAKSSTRVRTCSKKSAEERRALLGHEMAMIYQDALSSLNPAMLIRDQMKQLTRRGGTRSAEELLWLVGLDPKRTLESYPHELSGGQRQRVLIAMALTRDPKLIIADEPTTALDVTVQKQVIALLNELREKLGFAMIFVSHDLALVAEVAHHITVMYAGQVIEQAPTKELLTHPTHEYTRGLLGAVLSIESGSGRLHQVPGTVPSPRDFPVGDRFAPQVLAPRLWTGHPPGPHRGRSRARVRGSAAPRRG